MSHHEDPTKIVEVNKSNLFPGALEDTRPQSEKDKDYKAEEVTTFGPVDWVEKRFEDIKTFPVRNQDGSGSCVMATCALMLGIENYLEENKYIEFSFKDGYDRRSNKPGVGMIGVNALDILRAGGLTLNALMPSDNQSEAQISVVDRKISDEQIGKIFKIKDYVQLPFNIEKIAWTIESGRKNGVGKPVMVWFQFPRNEWTANPRAGNSTTDIVRHSVTAICYGIQNGEKGIFIQDSWGLHSSTVNGLRFISEDYINKRMIFCAYLVDLFNNWRDLQLPEPVKPKYIPGNIVSLQDCLKFEGLFSLSQASTGFYGPITRAAVSAFQRKYGLHPTGTGTVGPLTVQKLIELYP